MNCLSGWLEGFADVSPPSFRVECASVFRYAELWCATPRCFLMDEPFWSVRCADA